jgi:hypothetical protein
VALPPALTPSPALFALEITDGTNTLVITEAEVVVREIEFDRQQDDHCDDVTGDDDLCEKFTVGPMLISLPVDGGVARQLTVEVDTGTYDELEFDIHKPDDDTAADLAFLQEHPDFDDVSIRLRGTFNGEDFTFTTDLNEDQEIALSPPLVVTEDTGPINVTLTIDLSVWFRTSAGTLIDPRTALDGQPNENLVEDNIGGSIEGFRDDDEDGVQN